MSISTIGMIVFFAVYGISHFWGFPAAGVVLAVSALVVAIALLLSK